MTSHARSRRAPIALLAGLCLLTLGAPVLAQARLNPGAQGGGGNGAPDPRALTRPPRVGEVDSAKTLLHYVVGVGIIALCVGVVVIPGRREHDD